METRAESNSTLVGVDLDITKGLIEVCGDDDVDRLDGARERLVEILLGNLEFKESAVDLIDDDNWLNALAEGLSKHGLGLDAYTFDSVDDNEGTVGYTKSSRDFRGEINVTGRVNQVDQEVLAYVPSQRLVLSAARKWQVTIGDLANDVLQVFIVRESSI